MDNLEATVEIVKTAMNNEKITCFIEPDKQKAILDFITYLYNTLSGLNPPTGHR